jgi:pilus assembly protein CpaB
MRNWELSTYTANDSRGGGFSAQSHSSLRKYRRNKNILIGSAVLLGVLTIIGAINISNKTTEAVDSRAQIAPESQFNEAEFYGTVSLYAPTMQLTAGSKISQLQFKEVFWPRNNVPEGAVRSVDELNGMYATVDLQPGQPILHANLTSTPPVGGIESLLPEGSRAVTIEVDATTGIDGWAKPGAHVDLFLTFRDRDSGEDVTKLAVEDAVVLSFAGKAEREEYDHKVGRPISLGSSAAVTLAVPFEEALKIQTARAMGRISLALRNFHDNKSASVKQFSSDQFRGAVQTKTEEKKVLGSSPEGFAKYKDARGKEVQLELHRDRWRFGDDGM